MRVRIDRQTHIHIEPSVTFVLPPLILPPLLLLLPRLLANPIILSLPLLLLPDRDYLPLSLPLLLLLSLPLLILLLLLLIILTTTIIITIANQRVSQRICSLRDGRVMTCGICRCRQSALRKEGFTKRKEEKGGRDWGEILRLIRVG